MCSMLSSAQSLVKMLEEGTEWILIAIFWPHQIWFTTLFDLASGDCIRLPEVPDLLEKRPMLHHSISYLYSGPSFLC